MSKNEVAECREAPNSLVEYVNDMRRSGMSYHMISRITGMSENAVRFLERRE